MYIAARPGQAWAAGPSEHGRPDGQRWETNRGAAAGAPVASTAERAAPPVAAAAVDSAPPCAAGAVFQTAMAERLIGLFLIGKS